MDHERFREWFSHVDELTTAQCKEVAAVLSDPPVGRSLAGGDRAGAWMMSGAVRIAPAPGRCRAARHAVFAAIGARPAGRHSAHSRARRCRACTIRSAGWPSAPRLAQARRSERLPSAAGLRRARRIAGVTASWRRCAKRRTGLPGSSRRTRPSFSRAGRGSGSWIASRRRRGGKARKRGLSREQVPILVAADRAGATLSHTLPALNAKSVKEGAGAGRRPRCLARLRRQPLLSACRSGAGHPSREHQRRRPASGFAAPCTSRRSTAATARSRASCGASAASPPSTSTAISGGSISSNSAISHRPERVSRRRWPDHAYVSLIEPKITIRELVI